LYDSLNMKYLNISENEIKNLFKTLKKESSAQYFQRLQAIKLSSKGHSIKEISKMLDVHYNSVYHWITKYLKEGIKSLQDKPRSGRPRKISDSEMEIVEAIVNEEPRRLNVTIQKLKNNSAQK